MRIRFIVCGQAEAATELSAKEQTLAENRAETSLKLEEVGHMFVVSSVWCKSGHIIVTCLSIRLCLC